MPLGDFYDFLDRLGHRVVQAGGATWYDVQPRVFLAVPYFRIVKIEETAIREMFAEYHLRALRFPTHADQFGFESSIALNCNPDYGLHSQHQKARNQTRRGLESCRVERTDFAFLAREGARLNRDTAQRQGVWNQYVSEKYWLRFCSAAAECGGLSSWCAFLEGELAAFLVAAEVDGWVEWIVNHSLTQARHAYPNNALVYTAAQYFLQSRRCAGICFGLGSLEPTPQLDHFKLGMGWDLVPVKQRLALSRVLGAFARPIPLWTIEGIGRLFRNTYSIRKSLAILAQYKRQRA